MNVDDLLGIIVSQDATVAPNGSAVQIIDDVSVEPDTIPPKVVMRNTNVGGRKKHIAMFKKPQKPTPKLVDCHGRLWSLIEIDAIGDRIIYCKEKRLLKQIRERFPDLAVYFPPEMDKIKEWFDTMGHDEAILLFKRIHGLKKKTKGWIVDHESHKGGQHV